MNQDPAEQARTQQDLAVDAATPFISATSQIPGLSLALIPVHELTQDPGMSVEGAATGVGEHAGLSQDVDSHHALNSASAGLSHEIPPPPPEHDSTHHDVASGQFDAHFSGPGSHS